MTTANRVITVQDLLESSHLPEDLDQLFHEVENGVTYQVIDRRDGHTIVLISLPIRPPKPQPRQRYTQARWQPPAWNCADCGLSSITDRTQHDKFHDSLTRFHAPHHIHGMLMETLRALFEDPSDGSAR